MFIGFALNFALKLSQDLNNIFYLYVHMVL